MDFGAMLKDELSGDDLEQTQQLAANGKLDPAFALKSALAGAGTDIQLFKETLKGKSKDEIAKIEADYNQRYKPRTLKEDMAGELKISGREGFEIAEALKGDPDTIKDPARRMQAKLAHDNAAYEFERGSGAGFLDRGVRALSETFGDGTTRSVTDLFSDSGRLMDAHHQELAELGERMKRGEPLSPEQAQRMSTLVGYGRDDVENFRAAKDSVTNTAAAAGTAVVAAAAAAVIEVVSAGAATPAVVAAVSALVGGAAGMGIKAGLQGAGADPETARFFARLAGTSKLEEVFGYLGPSTSQKDGPLGRILSLDRPFNYHEHYGRAYDRKVPPARRRPQP